MFHTYIWLKYCSMCFTFRKHPAGFSRSAATWSVLQPRDFQTQAGMQGRAVLCSDGGSREEDHDCSHVCGCEM